MKKFLCILFGHPCERTGRHAIVLTEWRCRRCGGFYISHVDHGDMLIPADADSDRIFQDVKYWLENFPDGKPKRPGQDAGA